MIFITKTVTKAETFTKSLFINSHQVQKKKQTGMSNEVIMKQSIVFQLGVKLLQLTQVKVKDNRR